MLRVLDESSFPVRRVRAFASSRSAGSTLRWRDTDVIVEDLATASFEGIELALFSAGGSRSLQYAPIAARAGCVVVDNSSAWRMDPTVPLVVPEVNGHMLAEHRGIIANPNCSTIQMVLPLQALRARAELKRVVVATYQSASGAGQNGIDELLASTRAALSGEPVQNAVFPRPLAFDCIPRIGDFGADGYSVEEEKMMAETRKILGIPGLAVSATCVRVPVERGHQEAVTVDLSERVDASSARALFAAFPGISVMDEPSRNVYPVAHDCVGRNETFVGRLREDNTLPATLHFWVVSDNLLKGAAYNAVQIAEVLHEKGLVRVP
jgi:aspartate-semialdehyde dehydrogenase